MKYCWGWYKLQDSILKPRFFVDIFYDGGTCEPLTEKEQQDVSLQWCVTWSFLRISDCSLGGCVRRTVLGEECHIHVIDGEYFLEFPLLEDDNAS